MLIYVDTTPDAEPREEEVLVTVGVGGGEESREEGREETVEGREKESHHRAEEFH